MVVSHFDRTIWKLISHVTKNPCPGCSIFMTEEDCVFYNVMEIARGNGHSNLKKSSVQASKTI
jgi:hypothetical protein